MKVVYNNCFGGFSLSHEAYMLYAELKGIKLYPFVDVRENGKLQFGKMKAATAADVEDAFCVHYCTTPEYASESYWSGRDIDRADPALVEAVERLGAKANGRCAELAIEDVPAGTLYRIDEYDGNETVATRDSYEWKLAV